MIIIGNVKLTGTTERENEKKKEKKRFLMQKLYNWLNSNKM